MAKVLVIDDDPVLLRMLCDYIRNDLGHDVRFAGSGEEALKRMKEEIPDLAIVDILMPKMDGLELIAKIRENMDTKNVKILVLTALDHDLNIEIGKTMGADDYLTKPFELKGLSSKISKLLGGRPKKQ